MQNVRQILMIVALLVSPYGFSQIPHAEASSLSGLGFSPAPQATGNYIFDWWFSPPTDDRNHYRNNNHNSNHVPELDPQAALQVTTLLLGAGSLFVARRRRDN